MHTDSVKYAILNSVLQSETSSVTKVIAIITLHKHSNEKDHMIMRLRSRDLKEREITSFVRPTRGSVENQKTE